MATFGEEKAHAVQHQQGEAQREIAKELKEVNTNLKALNETLAGMKDAIGPALSINFLTNLKNKLAAEYEQIKKENRERGLDG
jgi:hypothetical protein